MKTNFNIIAVFAFLWSINVFPQGYDILEQEHSVNVEINGEPLKGVGWKEVPGLITTGVFSTSEAKLSPQKRGYRFSPDIFNFDDYNTNSAKIFRAYKYHLTDKLKFHLPFQENLLENILLENGATPIDIEYKKSNKGKVAYFNGVSSYIDYGSDDANFQELTISVWLKPEKISGSNSIIGKGEVFSAKIFNGNLQFTTPGIKDHTSYAVNIKPGEWIHVAYVYMPNDKVFFYLNGRLIDQKEASTIANTDHSVLIGSNLWGQYYNGLMSDFAMWNRALSDDEIYSIYQKGIPVKSNNAKLPVWAYFAGICLIVFIIVWILRRKKFSRKIVKIENEETIVLGDYHIELLGGLVLKSANGMEDITHLLSPKRKELFLLLLLFTLKSGGISSKKMGEILWPNFTPASIKNNRSTQIKELRKILEGKLPVDIIFSDKKWSLIIPNDIRIDLLELKHFIPELFNNIKHSTKQLKVMSISHLVNKGPFLPQLDLEWLDSFKADYGNTILDILTPYIEEELEIEHQALFNIIDAILVIDPLYETAVKKKIQLYVNEGKHMSAKKVMDSYKKLYESFYKEPYDVSLLSN
ncbi:LamG-like jellyroll fold domain-containing protein [Galbibacter sp. PAP.153]|uniref:LamG domain-containing protein n=1 Tax=Galbibacter sp. PAP.153 TaxID=3104623 RepID=UPI00300B6A46